MGKLRFREVVQVWSECGGASTSRVHPAPLPKAPVHTCSAHVVYAVSRPPCPTVPRPPCPSLLPSPATWSSRGSRAQMTKPVILQPLPGGPASRHVPASCPGANPDSHLRCLSVPPHPTEDTSAPRPLLGPAQKGTPGEGGGHGDGAWWGQGAGSVLDTCVPVWARGTVPWTWGAGDGGRAVFWGQRRPTWPCATPRSAVSWLQGRPGTAGVQRGRVPTNVSSQQALVLLVAEPTACCAAGGPETLCRACIRTRMCGCVHTCVRAWAPVPCALWRDGLCAPAWFAPWWPCDTWDLSARFLTHKPRPTGGPGAPAHSAG